MISKKAQPRISFNFADKRTTLPTRSILKSFIADIFRSEGTHLAQLDYIFCSDPYLRQINIDFLQHDYNTDIITFPLSPKGEPVEGEIYISIDTIKDNAKHYEVTTEQELLRVIFHGALHLCGYKDKTTKEQKLMREMEDKYLGKWNTLLK